MYIRTFFAVWDHYGVHAPAEYQDQVFKYLDLEHCHQALSCTAKDDIPESRFEDHVDARILCRELWHDRVGLFHTNRMRLQIHYLMLLSALSEERPGKMVEIQCFPCLKGGLLYSDHQVKIWPNKDDPAHPHVAVVVNIRGHRYHGYHWSNEWTGFAVLSPNLAAPAMCPVMSFLALAFLDDAFADVKTPEEVVHHPTRGHVLRYKPHIETRPVAREEELGSRQKCQGEA
ncbi:hypothetical protein EUX98_g1105 [Antrodiella citrinella]|uniref:Uncharacterized protein n=1 Tax=Antrodiella citrinella TaxID=2447956 RepID=A0A4S4N3W8_9APHY|nr:hypothetical protein EUX98_g1105 [Antrodiella citrinella]